MITIINDNIFNSKANIICHQTNCLGIMGGGIALQIKKKFPKVFLEYYELCHKYDDKSQLLGCVQYVQINNQQYIANCFGQENIGFGQQTNYVALEDCLESVHSKALRMNLSVAIPYKIGCGLAGGDWDVVYNLIKNIFEHSSVDCKIYKIED